MPFGVTGVWLGCCFVIYSFIGVEIVGVTSGEASDPARTIPGGHAAHGAGPVGDLHRDHRAAGGADAVEQLGVGESPFVSVLRRAGHSRAPPG